MAKLERASLINGPSPPLSEMRRAENALDIPFSSFRHALDGPSADAALQRLTNWYTNEGSPSARVVFAQDTTIDTSYTFPAKIRIRFVEGARLLPSTGVEVIITNAPENPSEALFGGAGTIRFSQNAYQEVFPEWFGIDGIDDSIALQKASDSFESEGDAVNPVTGGLTTNRLGGELHLKASAYFLKNTWIIRNHCRVIGLGRRATNLVMHKTEFDNSSIPTIGRWIIRYDSLAVGTFEARETLTGSITGHTGVVLWDNGGNEVIVKQADTDTFQVGETISGDVTMATATITAINHPKHLIQMGTNNQNTQDLQLERVRLTLNEVYGSIGIIGIDWNEWCSLNYVQISGAQFRGIWIDSSNLGSTQNCTLNQINIVNGNRTRAAQKFQAIVLETKGGLAKSVTDSTINMATTPIFISHVKYTGLTGGMFTVGQTATDGSDAFEVVYDNGNGDMAIRDGAQTWTTGTITQGAVSATILTVGGIGYVYKCMPDEGIAVDQVVAMGFYGVHVENARNGFSFGKRIRVRGVDIRACRHFVSAANNDYPLIGIGTVDKQIASGTIDAGALDVLASGTSTGPDNAVHLEDKTSSQFQTTAVLAGDICENTTDGSTASIAMVDGRNELSLHALTGGTDNDIDTGDAYNILPQDGVKSVLTDIVAFATLEVPVEAVVNLSGETAIVDSRFTADRLITSALTGAATYTDGTPYTIDAEVSTVVNDNSPEHAFQTGPIPVEVGDRITNTSDFGSICYVIAVLSDNMMITTPLQEGTTSSNYLWEDGDGYMIHRTFVGVRMALALGATDLASVSRAYNVGTLGLGTGNDLVMVDEFHRECLDDTDLAFKVTGSTSKPLTNLSVAKGGNTTHRLEGDLIVVPGDITAEGGYRQTIVGFGQNSVAASQTDVLLLYFPKSGMVSSANYYEVQRPGSITGLGIVGYVTPGETFTAGILSVEAWTATGDPNLGPPIQTPTGAIGAIDGKRDQRAGVIHFPKDRYPFNTREFLFLKLTTTSDFAMSGAGVMNLSVTVEIET